MRIHVKQEVEEAKKQEIGVNKAGHGHGAKGHKRRRYKNAFPSPSLENVPRTPRKSRPGWVLEMIVPAKRDTSAQKSMANTVVNYMGRLRRLLPLSVLLVPISDLLLVHPIRVTPRDHLINPRDQLLEDTLVGGALMLQVAWSEFAIPLESK